eukprot:jgi/Ulvmu1/5093/UM021_0110.1
MGGRRNNYAGWDSRASNRGNAFQGNSHQSAAYESVRGSNAFTRQAPGRGTGQQHNAGVNSRATPQPHMRKGNAFAGGASVAQPAQGRHHHHNAFMVASTPDTRTAVTAFTGTVTPSNAFAGTGQFGSVSSEQIAGRNGLVWPGQSGFRSLLSQGDAFAQNAFGMHGSGAHSGLQQGAPPYQQGSPMMNSGQQHVSQVQPQHGSVTGCSVFAPSGQTSFATVNAFAGARTPASAPTTNAIASQQQPAIAGPMSMQTSSGCGKSAFGSSTSPGGLPNYTRPFSSLLPTMEAGPSLHTGAGARVAFPGEAAMTPSDHSAWNQPAFEREHSECSRQGQEWGYRVNGDTE